MGLEKEGTIGAMDAIDTQRTISGHCDDQENDKRKFTRAFAASASSMILTRVANSMALINNAIIIICRLFLSMQCAYLLYGLDRILGFPNKEKAPKITEIVSFNIASEASYV